MAAASEDKHKRGFNDADVYRKKIEKIRKS
jgi:hypothetical protein